MCHETGSRPGTGAQSENACDMGCAVTSDARVLQRFFNANRANAVRGASLLIRSATSSSCLVVRFVAEKSSGGESSKQNSAEGEPQLSSVRVPRLTPTTKPPALTACNRSCATLIGIQPQERHICPDIIAAAPSAIHHTRKPKVKSRRDATAKERRQSTGSKSAVAAGRSTSLVLVGAMMWSAAVGTGCTSLHHIPIATAPASPALPVEPGDTIRLTLQDGRRVLFTVEAVQPRAIVARDGAHTAYALDDITRIERRQFSGVKTGFLIGGIAGGAFLVLLGFAVAAAYGALLGGG